MSRVAHPLVAAALGVGFGIALGAWWLGGERLVTGSPVASAPLSEPVASAELERLRAELAVERDARRALAREVERLHARIEPAETTPETEAEKAADVHDPDSTPGPPDSAWFDVDSLRELGLNESEIARLRERFEALELAELYLRDRAAREGWDNRPRYFRELRDLRENLRGEAGDDDYDCMLYAAARNNRVIVADVLDRSPAAEAGVAAGDEILAYGGRRMFDGQDLTRATARGEAGAWTEIRAQRADEMIRFFVPRGPLGVRLRPSRRPCDIHS